MEKITEKDLKKTVNYIIVNSQSAQAYNYSLDIAEKYIKQNPGRKVFFFSNDVETEKNVSIGGLPRFGRGKIAFIDNNKNLTPDVAIKSVVWSLKFGLLITSGNLLNQEDYNNFRTETFFKKGIDIIIHKKNLFLNSVEKFTLNEEKEIVKKTGKLRQNWVLRIYKDPDFSADKETFKKLLDIYGTVDAAGIMFTQLIVNKKEHENYFAHYKIFNRKNDAFFLPDAKNLFTQMLVSLGFDDNSITAFLNIFYGHEKNNEMDEKKLEQATETVETKEQSNTENTKLTPEQRIDKVLDEFADDFLNKVGSGELTMTNVMTNQDGLLGFIMPYHEKVKDIVEIDEFMLKFQDKIMSMFSGK